MTKIHENLSNFSFFAKTAKLKFRHACGLRYGVWQKTWDSLWKGTFIFQKRQNVKNDQKLKIWHFLTKFLIFDFSFLSYPYPVTKFSIFVKFSHFLHSFSKTWKNQNLSFVGILPNLKKLWPFLDFLRFENFIGFCHFHFKQNGY